MAGRGIAFARQSLPLIVDHGRLNPALNDSSQWGYTLGNAVRVWRTGAGIDRHGNLIYAAADYQTVTTLAEILQRAGAVRAMQLDINPEWPTLITYTHRGGLDPVKVVPNYQQPATRYLVPDDRDFFAVYRRLPGPVTVPVQVTSRGAVLLRSPSRLPALRQRHLRSGRQPAFRLRVLRFVDHSRRAVLPQRHVWAARARDHRAHTRRGVRRRTRSSSSATGSRLTPHVYAPLLDAWARAGYVVAAPVFPLGNANAPGGPNESDLVEPAGRHAPRDHAPARARHPPRRRCFTAGSIRAGSRSPGTRTAR